MDRFNDYPIEVERLLDSVQIKIHALRAGVTLIKDQGKQWILHYRCKERKTSMVKHCLNKHNRLVEL